MRLFQKGAVRGDGSFEPVENLELEMTASQVLCDDFDGDGDLDLMVVTDGGLPPKSGNVVSRMDLYENDGAGRFELAGSHDAGGSPSTAASGDLDRDGYPDVVVKLRREEGPDGQSTPSALSLIRNRGDGTFEEPRRVDAGHTPRFPHIADVDGDGLLDIVTVLWAGGVVTVLKNRGDLSSASCPGSRRLSRAAVPTRPRTR